jgi:hypothetical protein
VTPVTGLPLADGRCAWCNSALGCGGQFCRPLPWFQLMRRRAERLRTWTVYDVTAEKEDTRE